MNKLQRFFQRLIQTEEALYPIFLHNPQTQAIAGAVLVTESVFASLFGMSPAAPAQTAPVGPALVPPVK